MSWTRLGRLIRSYPYHVMFVSPLLCSQMTKEKSTCRNNRKGLEASNYTSRAYLQTELELHSRGSFSTNIYPTTF